MNQKGEWYVKVHRRLNLSSLAARLRKMKGSVKEGEGGEKRGTAREAAVLDTVLQNPDL
jgi:hypothetical protein